MKQCLSRKHSRIRWGSSTTGGICSTCRELSGLRTRGRIPELPMLKHDSYFVQERSRREGILHVDAVGWLRMELRLHCKIWTPLCGFQGWAEEVPQEICTLVPWVPQEIVDDASATGRIMIWRLLLLSLTAKKLAVLVVHVGALRQCCSACNKLLLVFSLISWFSLVLHW